MTENKKIYPIKNNCPVMVPSFVCYADILGYAQMSKEAIKTDGGSSFLTKLHIALSTAHQEIRKEAKYTEEELFFDINIFTDNIVIGYPVIESYLRGESEWGHIFSIFSEFQISLACKGFFIRGGIAYGPHYMDGDVVFGEALLEAVGLDKHGGPPRIVLANSAKKKVEEHINFYSDYQESPQYEELLTDSDGSFYLDYLGQSLKYYDTDGIDFKIFGAHKKQIVSQLRKFKGNSDIRAKYVWAARYHNFVCHEFLSRFPVREDEKVNKEYSALYREVQRLKDYLIDIESLAPRPTRISFER